MSAIARCVTPEELTFLNMVAQRAPDPLKAIDVGAHAGEYSEALLARRPNARIMAFEPQRAAHALLQERLGASVYAYSCGLSNEPTLAKLRTVPGGPCLQATVEYRPDFDGYHGTALALSAEEPVKLERLDDLRWPEVLGDRVHLMKVDVEGHELAVFEGAAETLLTTDIVQFEFNDCALYAGVAFQDVEHALRRFRIHALTDDGPARDWIAGPDVEGDRLVWRGPTNFVAIADACQWWTPRSLPDW